MFLHGMHWNICSESSLRGNMKNGSEIDGPPDLPNQTEGGVDNLRQDKRLEADAEIRFRYPEVFTGKMRDFCPGGIGADIPITMEINSPVEMEILEGKILASGHVRWLRIENETVTIGIQFRQGERELMAQIQDWKGGLA